MEITYSMSQLSHKTTYLPQPGSAYHDATDSATKAGAIMHSITRQKLASPELSEPPILAPLGHRARSVLNVVAPRRVHVSQIRLRFAGINYFIINYSIPERLIFSP